MLLTSSATTREGQFRELAIDSVRLLLGPGERVDVAIIGGEHSVSATVDADGASESTSKFLLYSLTKTVQATAALRLVEEGILRLGSDLGPWLPEFPVASRFTLRQVLQHTSGLPDYGGLPEYFDAIRRQDGPWSEEDFLQRTHAASLRFEPGSQFAYSNIGYMLLNRVLERALGTNLQQLFNRTVFAPLGIRDASIPSTRSDLADYRFGESRALARGSKPVQVAGRYHPAWIAPKTIGCGIDSAATIFCGLLTGRLLSQESLSEMTRPLILDGSPGGPWEKPGYGLGLMMDEWNGEPALGNRGGGPGCSSAVFHFAGPLKRAQPTIAAITNTEDPDQPVWIVKAIVNAFR